MNVYDGIHWNIYEILPYQRNFNFINSIRSTGKTYTYQMFILDKAITKHQEFIMIVRTQNEKQEGVFEEAFQKVILEKFPEYQISFTKDECYLESDNENEPKRILGYCIALSEYVKVKKRTFPNVKYMYFEEYMLENNDMSKYVEGRREPDLLLNIYHTVDREQDRVILFAFGNNTAFYNPYHLHPAFKIPKIEVGEIWTSENVLFQRIKPSEKLKKLKSKSKFLKMIDNTDYGKYANKGEYVDDNFNLIEPITTNTRYLMTLIFEGNKFGVSTDMNKGVTYISDKIDPYCTLVFALTLDDHSENTTLTRGNKISHLQWLSRNYKLGNVRYTSIEVKLACEKGLAYLL